MKPGIGGRSTGSHRRGARARRRAGVLALTLSAAALAVGGACSADGGGGSGSGGSGGSGGTGGGVAFDAGDASQVTPDSACAIETLRAEPIPLDLYIMLDKSGSMTDTLDGGVNAWGVVTGALLDFLGQSPATDGIGVGIQYFPSFVPKNPCTTAADCGGGRQCLVGTCLGNWPGACTVSDYSTPAVPITELPGARAAIQGSLLVQSPAGGTPTSAALQGAVDYATRWAQAHPDHKVAVVLATDGDPSECETGIGAVAAIALAAASATPPVETYVVGFGLLSNLDQIALAGGTDAAFNLDPASPGAAEAFVATMNEIRQSALGCEYLMPIPTTGTVDPGRVNVLYTPGAGDEATLPHKLGASACGSGPGWFYDDEASPTRLFLCPASCAAVSTDAAAQIEVLVGCATVVE